MPRVFISHSTQDRAFVEQEIVALLERCGVETWYSKDSIQPTDQWERSILQGLKSCDVFLLVMSPRSAQSPWVKREVDWVFIKGGRRIIPVLMEECDPDDFHFGIGGIQHLDFSKDRALGREALARLWGKTERPASEGPRSPSSETISIASGGKIGDVIEVPLDSSLKMKLAWVPPGTSWLGGGGGKPGPGQVHAGQGPVVRRLPGDAGRVAGGHGRQSEPFQEQAPAPGGKRLVGPCPGVPQGPECQAGQHWPFVSLADRAGVGIHLSGRAAFFSRPK